MAIIHLTDQSFSEKVVDSSGVVLVDFWAPWCAPCRMLGPILEEMDQELDSKAKVAKINVDDNPKTARQFGIMGIPNLIIFKDGQKVEQLVGLQTKENLKKAIEKHL
jgi:thioredoxin 1